MLFLKLFLTILVSVVILMSYSTCRNIKSYIFTTIYNLILTMGLIVVWRIM